MSRFTSALIFLLSFCTASAQTLIPTQINVGSPVIYFGTTQGVILHSVIIPSTGSATPTGTVQFFANGGPVGSPYTVGPEFPGTVGNGYVTATLPINVSGSYTITAAYSGDATHSAATSYNSLPAVVVQNPSTVVINAAASSLTFASGATTGNTDLLTFVSVNGFYGSTQYSCAIAVNPGTPAPAYPPACALLNAISPDGNPANLLSIATHAPVTVPITSAALRTELPAATVLCGLLLILPSLRRSRPYRALLIVLCGVALTSLSACSAGPAATGSSGSTSTQTITDSSTGSYTITIAGQAYPSYGASSGSTIFSLTIPLTVK